MIKVAKKATNICAEQCNDSVKIVGGIFATCITTNLRGKKQKLNVHKMDLQPFLITFIGLCMIALPFVFGNADMNYDVYSQSILGEERYDDTIGRQLNYFAFMFLKWSNNSHFQFVSSSKFHSKARRKKQKENM